LGRRGRKGAADTFDAAGYVALLRRLRTPDADVVYAPTFFRDIEEPIGSGVAITPETLSS
jgi:pantothenate kinase